MKLNIFTKSMIGMGLVCSALPALAMEAWNNQQGGNKYQVIFDGKIYENAWWVSSTNCPGKAKANDATNPWRLKRTATAAEISQFGNTLSCEKSGSSSSSNSGDNIKMVVTLIHPIAMDDGLRFAIREGGRTVGAGVVAKVLS
ncbi:hypothetical protein ABLC74_22565 [Escherichia coli]|uniref:EF-Tu C-terminal domain-related protein n=1 Tax=Escherichia coli TaxID=562 RepID=UPI0036DC6CF1